MASPAQTSIPAATPAKPQISQTTLRPTDTQKPPITVTGSSPLIEAIVNNGPFPSSPANITVGQVSAEVSAGGQFKLQGVDNAPVSFLVSASATSALAAYQDPSSLVSDLGFVSGDGKQLNVSFRSDGKSRFLVVRWGFDASGNVSGKMALNPAVSITFGASGGADGLFAFVTSVDKAMRAGDAFVKLLDRWCTPADVATSALALSPGSWIVTEVTGQISANLGVTAGYDLNWVRKVSLNDLEGDIGLRISLGLQAMLSAQLAGKFYLVLNRDNETAGVRLRLFRAKTKGWGFALNASADVTPSTGSFLPHNLDDFIRGILGIHSAQLIKFLEASNVTDIGDALGSEFLEALRADGNVTNAFSDLQNLLQKWENLPTEVTTVLWKAASQITDLSAIQKAAQQISQMSDNSIRGLLDSLLQNTSFHKDPVCEWLESTASKTVFDLYEGSDFTPLRLAASQVAAVLDGSTLQSTLTNLKTQVDKALDLGKLETALASNDLTGVAGWVNEQLAKFLGVDLSGLKNNFDKINKAITTIRNKAQNIYQATVKALNNTYGFSLDYAYNSSDTQSVLIDVEFQDAAQPSLASAIKGDFQQILSGPVAGVKLNVCALAHAIQRHTHIETHLPWFTGISDDLATGYAKQTLADADGGRVQFFEMGATDTATMQRNAGLKRFASCSIGISAKAEGVRKYNVSAVDFGYSFITSNAKMTRSSFEYDFGGAAAEYFPNQFGNTNADPNHAPFESWVVDWDKFTDTVQGLPTADGVIGNTWVNLQVRSRAKNGYDWVSALIDGTVTPDYMAMSRAMQKLIRKYLLMAYGNNAAQYRNVPGRNWISAFLIYTALPGLNDFSYDGNTLKPNPKGNIVWDVRKPELTAAVTNAYVGPNLHQNLSDIADLLVGISELKGSAQFYRNADSAILGYVLNGLVTTDPYITFLQSEKTVIDGAQKAFEDLRKAGSKQVAQSLPNFSAGLVTLVQSFNSALASLSVSAPQVMRLFAPLVFEKAIEAMFGGNATLPHDALLDVAVLKGTSIVDLSQTPSPDQIVLQQRLTSFS